MEKGREDTSSLPGSMQCVVAVESVEESSSPRRQKYCPPLFLQRPTVNSRMHYSVLQVYVEFLLLLMSSFIPLSS